MRNPTTSRRCAALVAVCALLALSPAPASAAEDGGDAWRLLERVRQSLTDAGPQEARFEQTFIPAGFSSGEAESGRLALALPSCLRFDYQEPYPKSFLLCGSQVHAWNQEDRRGQRSVIDRSSEPGLDLLLLPTDELGSRYQARTRRIGGAGGARMAIDLTPKPGAPTGATDVTEATLVVDPESLRLVEVTYRDGEGNRTRFVLGGYRDINPTEALFEPPSGIRWEDG